MSEIRSRRRLRTRRRAEFSARLLFKTRDNHDPVHVFVHDKHVPSGRRGTHPVQADGSKSCPTKRIKRAMGSTAGDAWTEQTTRGADQPDPVCRRRSAATVDGK